MIPIYCYQTNLVLKLVVGFNHENDSKKLSSFQSLFNSKLLACLQLCYTHNFNKLFNLMIFIVANIFLFISATVIFRCDISSSRSVGVKLGSIGVGDMVMFATQNW